MNNLQIFIHCSLLGFDSEKIKESESHKPGWISVNYYVYDSPLFYTYF